ncbi:amino acid permease [Psychrilyobacter piezotolerans]|uniref:Amino acid permease n=2 Tax=Fusobacteriaceae TaxID=203492 RepID=A0ABX9KDA8_9FUSO|nr:amino acid permease [Psychrilyobacter sp. S5]REI39542.1 amino acid permease [Psychrilyobacter piezotolerans]
MAAFFIYQEEIRGMEKKKYLSITALVMIIFVGVFGFGNIANNYKTTGTESTSMFILGATIYFLPLCLIMSEFAAYAKDRTGGIYSWIDIGLGKNTAYFALWCYFVANIFYLPTLASRVPTYLSFAVTGSADISDIAMAVLSAVSLVAALFVGIKYESKFNKISTVTGYISLFVAGIFLVGGIGMYLGFFGTPATEITAKSLVMAVDTKENFGKMLSTFAWIIFAYAGSELVGTYVDRVENPEKNFTKGILLSAIIIGFLYILGIISIAAYGTVEDFSRVSLVNAVISGYAFMGNTFGFGIWFVKMIGLTYSLITLVALVLWSVALSKVVFSEAPAGTFPAWLTQKNKNGILKNALFFQTSLSFLFILITTFGGESAGDLYYKIYDMSTMAFILPYLFLSVAYINFRRKGHISSFQISKNNYIAYGVGVLITILNIMGIIFAGYDINLGFMEQIDTLKLYYGGLAMFLGIGVVIKFIKFKECDVILNEA